MVTVTRSYDFPSRVRKTLGTVKVLARVSLGLVWLYEGLVPKILFLNANPAQIDLVRHSGLFWPNPALTLIALGIAQAIMGAILIAGWAERLMVTLATLWMLALIFLVATGNPAMLTDPFGALAKDLCLVSCAATVWLLSPMLKERADR
jgi:uncharacterized membrane protein YphA (DoxX/SURF4 family)